ncbi:MAG: phosphate ABC transporter permease subunit PstC [Caulobacteraceae bacterium]
MLIWSVILILTASSFALYRMGRARALAGVGGRQAALHSLPGYHGLFVALWAAAPAILVLLLIAVFAGRIETAIVSANPPAVVAALPAERAELFWHDVIAAGSGEEQSHVTYEPALKAALAAEAKDATGVIWMVRIVAVALALVLAGGGFAYAYPRIGAAFRARNRVEDWVGLVLGACALIAVLGTVGIVASLAVESWRFFQSVSPIDFLFGLQWSPQIAMRTDQVAAAGAFGAVPLFAGTFLITFIAMLVAAPVGLYAAIYLSEYASARTRAFVKPALEILAGVPTVVYGFFAALTVGPLFRAGFNALGAKLMGGPLNDLGLYLSQVQNQMALVAGAVMGIMLIPFVSSLSDDIINAVPQSLRDGSYAMGATKSETVKRVILPAALPGVMAAMLLAISRAVGETMIVTLAAGLQAKLTANPLETVTTVTVQIVTLLTGDQEFDSPKTLSAFGLALALFLVTLGLNVVAHHIVRRFREQYD